MSDLVVRHPVRFVRLVADGAVALGWGYPVVDRTTARPVVAPMMRSSPAARLISGASRAGAGRAECAFPVRVPDRGEHGQRHGFGKDGVPSVGVP